MVEERQKRKNTVVGKHAWVCVVEQNELRNLAKFDSSSVQLVPVRRQHQYFHSWQLPKIYTHLGQSLKKEGSTSFLLLSIDRISPSTFKTSDRLTLQSEMDLDVCGVSLSIQLMEIRRTQYGNESAVPHRLGNCQYTAAVG